MLLQENTPQAKIAYKGESEEYKKTNNELYIIFALALVTAYLAMCAQFESWRHPFTIMLTVPMAILGGLLGLLVVGSSLNVYSQIALVILIGLSAKNGILIVEFANQLRKEGKKFETAIIEAATIRLRPILMTSLSTIFGVSAFNYWVRSRCSKQTYGWNNYIWRNACFLLFLLYM